MEIAKANVLHFIDYSYSVDGKEPEVVRQDLAKSRRGAIVMAAISLVAGFILYGLGSLFIKPHKFLMPAIAVFSILIPAVVEAVREIALYKLLNLDVDEPAQRRSSAELIKKAEQALLELTNNDGSRGPQVQYKKSLDLLSQQERDEFLNELRRDLPEAFVRLRETLRKGERQSYQDKVALFHYLLICENLKNCKENPEASSRRRANDYLLKLYNEFLNYWKGISASDAQKALEDLFINEFDRLDEGLGDSLFMMRLKGAEEDFSSCDEECIAGDTEAQGVERYVFTPVAQLFLVERLLLLVNKIPDPLLTSRILALGELYFDRLRAKGFRIYLVDEVGEKRIRVERGFDPGNSPPPVDFYDLATNPKARDSKGEFMRNRYTYLSARIKERCADHQQLV